MEKKPERYKQGTVYLIDKCGEKRGIRNIRYGDIQAYMLLMNFPHSFIPKIYGVEGCNGKIKVFEEYVEGKIISEVCFTEESMLAAAKELCQAAEHIHRLGVIHRDIRPSNIIMAADGHIRLIDFDIAVTAHPYNGGNTSCFGTRGFAPPEQYGFSQVDARSDVYALGMTLESIFGSLSKEEQYRRIINKCTQFDPNKRYQSAREVLSDLGTADYPTDYKSPQIRYFNITRRSIFGVLIKKCGAYIITNNQDRL